MSVRTESIRPHSFEKALVPFGRLKGAEVVQHKETVLDGLAQDLHTALKTTQIGQRCATILPVQDPFTLDQVTTLKKDSAQRLVDQELTQKCKGVLSHGDIARCLRGKDTPGHDLKKRGFKLIHYAKEPALQHKDKDAAGLLFPVSKDKSTVEMLQPVIMAQQMQELIDRERLSISLPEYHVIDAAKYKGYEAFPASPKCERYVLAVRDLKLPSEKDSIKNFMKLPVAQKQKIAGDLCRLIVATGFSDISPANIRIDKEGQLHILSTNPKGLLKEEGDEEQPAKIEKRARKGLQNILDSFPIHYHLFQLTAVAVIQELDDRELFSSGAMVSYALFREAILQDAEKDVQLKAYDALPESLQEFFAVVVWKACGEPEKEYDFGRKILLKDPSILKKITNENKESIFDQFEVRNAIFRIKEILTELKRAMLSRRTNLAEFRDAMLGFIARIADDETTEGRVLHGSIGRQLEAFAKTAPKDPRAFMKECHRVFFSRVTGMETCLIDRWIAIFERVSNEINIPQTTRRLKEKTDSEFVPNEAAPREQILPERFLASGDVTEEDLANKIRVLNVAYECATIGLTYGGLAGATWGQAKSLQERGHAVTNILPYFDTLPDRIKKDLKVLEVINYVVNEEERQATIYTNQGAGGTSALYIEDTWGKKHGRDHFDVHDPDHFQEGDGSQIYEDGILRDINVEWKGLKERMAFFSIVLYHYIRKHREEFDATIFNDWHGAYAMHRLNARNPQLDLPATLLAIHNNNFGCQGDYSGTRLISILKGIGEPRAKTVSVLRDCMRQAHQVMTVSPSFAEEMQHEPLDAGMGRESRMLAYANRFSGIANGSNPDIWNPAGNPTLKNWRDPSTHAELAQCTPVDLSFSADQPEQIFAKKTEARIQLQKALQRWYPEVAEKFDVTKGREVLLFVGRYDSEQKGLEMLLPMYKAAKEKGALLIVMGINEDPNARKILDLLEAEVAKDTSEDGFASAWITRGTPKVNASLKMQKGDLQKGIPALGPVIRAAATFQLAPSSFEPCGLVQYEGWGNGCPTIACATGGLKDTIDDDPESDTFNGFLFKRLRDFTTERQGQLAAEAVDNAIDWYRDTEDQDRLNVLVRIMQHSLSCSWTRAPAGQKPPVEQYEILLQAAIKNKAKGRPLLPVDLHRRVEPAESPDDGFLDNFTAQELYETLGSHITDEGVRFAVWAPRALEVSIVLKNEDGETVIPMKPHSALNNGIWEMEVIEGQTVLNENQEEVVMPLVEKGQVYEYRIRTFTGEIKHLVDPFASAFEKRPLRGSVVWDPDQFEWNDEAWMDKRVKEKDQERPLLVYEVMLGSWRRKNDRVLNYRDYAPLLVDYCKKLGYTHVELMGVMEYSDDASWGYQIKGLFAPTARYGTPEDFQFLIDELHKNGVGIFFDVPYYHFQKDRDVMTGYDGGALFEIARDQTGITVNPGASRIARDGWGTAVFDLDRRDVRKVILGSVHAFMKRYHGDGYRVDAVSATQNLRRYNTQEWDVSAQGTHENLGGIRFLQDMSRLCRKEFPGLWLMTENSDHGSESRSDTAPVEKGGFGFDRRWNMSRMTKVKQLMKSDDEKRMDLFRAFTEQIGKDDGTLQMGEFSHDECAKGTKSFYNWIPDKSTQFEQFKMFLFLEALQPLSGRLTFMGTEFGQVREWSSAREIDWNVLKSQAPEDARHQIFLKTAIILNRFYLANEAFWTTNKDRFNWVWQDKKNLIIAYQRIGKDGTRFTVVHNFGKKAFKNYKIAFQDPSNERQLVELREVLNSDHRQLDGTGEFMNPKVPIIRSAGNVSFTLDIPAYSGIVFKEIDGIVPQAPSSTGSSPSPSEAPSEAGDSDNDSFVSDDSLL